LALFLILIFFFFFCWCAGWRYIEAFTQVLAMYQIYHTWIYTLHCFPLSSAPPFPGTVSTGIIFTFTYMCTQYLHHIHPLTLFSWYLPPCTGTNVLAMSWELLEILTF
jgi:hypothetical protein